MSGTYRWLSVDPVLRTEGAIANSQAWNLYSFCRNNPVTLADPRGDVVICNNQAAFDALLNSIGDKTLASKITWDKVTGIVSIAYTRSDNDNFESLNKLITSSQVVEISVADSTQALAKVGDKYLEKWVRCSNEKEGIMIPPQNGRPSPWMRIGNTKNLLVLVGRTRGDSSRLSEQARTMAHELYGHAFLYISGLPFLHDVTPQGQWDPNGFVNKYIDKIAARKY